MCARAGVAVLRPAPLRRAYTCRHKATAPQATHVHMTVYVSCRACVHCALSAGVCMRSVGTLFRARGIDATVGVQRSASTAPVPKGTPSAMLGPHSPRARTRASCCRPPPVLGAGFRWDPGLPVQRSRADLFPVPLKREQTAKEGKTPQWDANSSRVRNSAFRPSRHPPQYQKVRAPCADHMALNKLGRPLGRPPGPSPQQTRSPVQVKLRHGTRHVPVARFTMLE